MREQGEVILAVAGTLPVLLLRLLGSVLGIAFRSKRSAARFRRTLQSSGVGPDLVRRLTSHYRDQTSLMRLIRLAVRSAR